IVAVEVGYFLITVWWPQRKRSKEDNPARLSLVQRVKQAYRSRAVIALSLLTLPYLPIAAWQAPALLNGEVGKTWFQPVSLLSMVDTLGRRFGVNRIPDPFWEAAGACVYAGLVILGLVVVWRLYR